MNDIVREFEMTPWERAAAQAKRTEEADLWKDFSKTLTRNSAARSTSPVDPRELGEAARHTIEAIAIAQKVKDPGFLTGA